MVILNLKVEVEVKNFGWIYLSNRRSNKAGILDFYLSYTPPSVPKIIKIGDGHFQLCQKVAGLTWNDPAARYRLVAGQTAKFHWASLLL